jgi:choline kinase
MHKVAHRPWAAVILAAGDGSRMGSLTPTQPKCLLEVGGRSLIEAQVGSLARFGVHDITIVVGYRGDRIRERLKNRVSYVENRRYRETNSLYSGRRLADILDRLIGAGHENAWAPLTFAEIARERRLWAVPTGGMPWTEIDFPEDLERARHLVAPSAAFGFRSVANAATY